MLKQRTIAAPVKTVGIGLHTGRKVTLQLLPAPVDTGIIFRRVDLKDSVGIPAHAHGVTDTRLATVLQNGDTRVSTVEHLLSACAGLGIDNLIIELDCENSHHGWKCCLVLILNRVSWLGRAERPKKIHRDKKTD